LTEAITPLRRRLIMWLVTGALFMEILDGTILTTALPSMARTFGTTAVALDIGISAYMLALGVLIPASSWLADRFGSRRIFVTAIAIFTLASALCGQAQSVPEFVALRVLQGVGGAMMTPVGRLVVMRHTPRDQLIATLSALIWPALFAPVVGPPVGGFITEHLGWRWIFYFNVPLGILALVAALWLIPDVRGRAVSSTGPASRSPPRRIRAPDRLRTQRAPHRCAGLGPSRGGPGRARGNHGALAPQPQSAASPRRAHHALVPRGGQRRHAHPHGDWRRAVPPAADDAGRLRLWRGACGAVRRRPVRR
jgi:MFS family permease